MLDLVLEVRIPSSLLNYLVSIPDMTPAPGVGFNLTYVCPEGMVFNHDWFASPFVMMTCQVIFLAFTATVSYFILRILESLTRLGGTTFSVCCVSITLIHIIFICDQYKILIL